MREKICETIQNFCIVSYMSFNDLNLFKFITMSLYGKGRSFTHYVDKILGFLTSIDIFYLIKVAIFGLHTFNVLSLWTPPQPQFRAHYSEWMNAWVWGKLQFRVHSRLECHIKHFAVADQVVEGRKKKRKKKKQKYQNIHM